MACSRSKRMELRFELARLTGTVARQDTWLDNRGHWGSPVSEICSRLDAIGLEPSEFLRLSAGNGFSGRTIKYHCHVANQSQCFYRSVSREQWLRTLIVSPRPGELFGSADANLVIHSNVMPRKAYVKAPCLEPQHCGLGFFPAHEIVYGLDFPFPRSCNNCTLAEHFSRTEIDGMAVPDEVDTLLRFWFLEEEDVEFVKDLGGGSEGEVSEVRWRKGVFARKRFSCEALSEALSEDLSEDLSEGPSEQKVQNPCMNRELEVALRVSHPNLVHCFGCSRWADSAECCDLFMELLEVDLGRFLNEQRETGELPFLFRDVLDVLLQIAQAMKHLHEKSFVHGDLKPQNIFMSCFELAHSGVQYHLVKVGDFGCAQRVDSFSSDVGTRDYTAPEVLSCRERRGAPPEHPQKIDVYSFGVVAFQVLTGVTKVYEGRKGIPEAVIQGRLRPDCCFDVRTLDSDRSALLPLIRSCWTSNPEDRPAFSQICAELDGRLDEHDRKLQSIDAEHKRQGVGDSFRNCNIEILQRDMLLNSQPLVTAPPSTPSLDHSLRTASSQASGLSHSLGGLTHSC